VPASAVTKLSHPPGKSSSKFYRVTQRDLARAIYGSCERFVSAAMPFVEITLPFVHTVPPVEWKDALVEHSQTSAMRASRVHTARIGA
jgi:hypothetical protein